ncbi:hypothetical protein [Pseudogracilibacillus sp. SO30301A]|uniref:hypothetical protein n=1 Tax=Pseudogracilibacillus sp. SO30301A TaxID=3098291 RepID=UPI00300E597A
MRLPIRFFSIGLFTAGILSLGFYFLNDSSKESIENVAVEDLIVQVEENGYRVITEDEFISFSMYVDSMKEEESKTASAKTEKEKDAEKDKEKDKEKEKEEEKSKEKEKDTKKKDDKEKETKKKKEDKVKKVKFTIKKGDVTEDIADTLVDKKILKKDERDKFIKYLEDNDYSPYIQLGTFEVTSEMNIKELAETVTTYPKD